MTESDSNEIKCLFIRKPRIAEKCSRTNVVKSANLKKIKNNSSTNYNSIENYHKWNTVDTEKFIKDNSIYIYVHKKKRSARNKRRKYDIYQYTKDEILSVIKSRKASNLYNHYSLLQVTNKRSRLNDVKQVHSSDIIQTNKHQPYHRTYIVNNCCRTCDKPECGNPFLNPSILAKVYRCQTGPEETCCCSCNSDAMFEVMKSLYDCYKKKNCVNCRCILCGYGRKKSVGVGEGEALPGAEALDGKTPEEKEKYLRDLVMKKKPLPVGRTPSEKNLIAKVRRDMGVPPEPTNDTEKKKLQKAYADGLVSPLEGKTPKEKEKTLKRLFKAGIPLPEGRTDSEKELIARIKRGGPSLATIPSAKLKKAKEEGLLTPLDGKTPEQQEKILTGLAKLGMPLPTGKTPSQKKLIDKVRADLGLPPEPKNSSERAKLRKAYADGIITPLEGKTPEEKEKALRKMAEAGIPLPEGRTPSEKALIEKVKATTPPRTSAQIPSDKIAKARAEGFITPLTGKTPEEKEKILRGLAKHGIPLPEGKTPSEKKLIDKVRKDMGLPPEPKTSDERKKMRQAYADGIVTPLEGKTPEQKEKALRKMVEAGIPLPEGRTPSEKALIAKVKGAAAATPSEKMRKAKAEGLITPLEGKTPEQKEKILRGLAKHGIPLPEGKTPSEKKLIDKVRQEMGLPPEPKTSAEKAKMAKAYADGIITPLEGKTPEQKEQALRKMAEAGIPLPEGRTPSEKALIDKVKAAAVKRPTGIPSEKFRKAKAEGLITPLEGKTPEQKEKILRGLAINGIPLPEGKTPSEKKLIDKVRQEMGLPPEPKTSAEKAKLKQAYADGIITPLEGKTPEQKEKALRKMAEAGIPLPEGRTPSEKALIDKVKATTKVKRPSGIPSGIPSEKLRKAKAEGLITPLEGKTPEQKEKILRGLAVNGIPLPEGKTPSEKKLIDKVRKEMGLPPEPKTSAEKARLKQAYADGIITPLEGKTPEQKEKALRRMAAAGIPLPEGRTPSEKALIDKVKATTVKRPSGVPSGIPSEKLRKAKAEGFITPLEGKTPEQKEKILRGLAKHGIPLPEGKTPSEKDLIKKVKQEMGLPPEPKNSAEKAKIAQAYADGIVTPLEGKTPEEKEKALRRMAAAGIPLPEGRSPSEKALIDKVKATTAKRPTGVPSGVPSDKIRKAKAEGLFTPLKGKTPEEKEKILRGLAKHGLPLPEGKTPSEKDLIRKIRHEMGLPPEPKNSAERAKLRKAYADGIITPLEGKTPEQKEKALRRMAEAGVPLPEGRTPSEKALIDKVKATATAVKRPTGVPSDKFRKAVAEGLFTPLAGKTPEQKERILKGLAKNGMPLPEGKTPSEKALVDKVRKDLGLPPGPKTPSEKDRFKNAYAQGIVTPLEGKTPDQKEKALRRMKDAGIPLPEGRTPSEQALINKIKAERPKAAPSEKLRKAKAAGLLTPLEGKTPEQKEKILRGLAELGLPLPEGKTDSEKKLIDKVRKDMGLPPEPKTPSEKVRMAKLYAKGIITPLEGKSPAEKEKALRRMAEAGIPLPEGRTPSEKALIDKIRAETPLKASAIGMPSEKLRQAKAAGLLTPLEGKTPEEKEKILRGLAKLGMPLPEGKTPSEKKLIDKVRKEMGLPKEPKTPSEKVRFAKSYAKGIITPLEGKTPEEKEKILRRMQEAGIPLPEGNTPSEKALIAKIEAEAPKAIPSEKLRKARAAGFLTPLEGKTPEQKEKILRGLAQHGIPLPEGKTPSEKDLINKVRKEMGLPPEPKTSAERKKLQKAYADGIVTPLEGKTPEQKEKALRKMAEAGIPLPEGRTPSEKALIDKVKATTVKRPTGLPSFIPTGIPSAKLKKAKAEGFITPLAGKTPEQKEKILRGLAANGIPLPEGKTPSEKKMIDKIRQEMGLPPEPKTSSEQKRLNKAYADGIVTPLEGKTPEQKEKALRKMAEAGIPLPEGRTPSEKALIDKVKASTKVKRPSGIPSGIPSEKLKKAKAEGFITPLAGKTPEQKEKILRGLAANGIPLPEGKTPSEKKLIDKIRQEMGLPPEPKTSSERKRLNKAYADGIVTPLEGKTPEQKEKALRKMAEAGIPLPEGRTPSEKALIDKVKATTVRKPSGVPTEKFQKAKAEGLITPLEGKTPEQKKKILQGLAVNGIPFPEGKTPSEKKLMDEVRKEMGLPPVPKTSSEKALMKRAYADGIITPLEGKSAADKEKALKKMLEAGIPLPEGRTASEKALIEKVKAEGPRPSEVKRRLKGKGISVGAKPAGFEGQEIEEIAKTTKCDRGCGCDRKKIRFKHSYVKIRVTSPDISSFCDCPDECIPGVKGGVFVDNEGIKVTIGFSSVPLGFQSGHNSTSKVGKEDMQIGQEFMSFCSAALGNEVCIDTSEKKALTDDYDLTNHTPKNTTEKSEYLSNRSKDFLPEVNFGYSSLIYDCSQVINGELEGSASTDLSSVYILSSNTSTYTDLSHDITRSGSYDSILLVRTESTLSFSVDSQTSELAKISVISFGSTISALGNDEMSVDSIKFELDGSESKRTLSKIRIISTERFANLDIVKSRFFGSERVTILRFSRSKKRDKTGHKKGEKKVKINDSENIMKIVAEEILNQTEKSDSSSVFVVVNSEDDTNTEESSSPSLSVRENNRKSSSRESYPVVTSEHQIRVASRGVKLMSVPRDIRDIREQELEKQSKNRRYDELYSSDKPSTQSESEIVRVEKDTNKKKKREKKEQMSGKVSNRGNEIHVIERNVESLPYHARGEHVCSYHRDKIYEKRVKERRPKITVQPKQYLGFDLNVQSGNKNEYTNTTKRIKSKPTSMSQIIHAIKRKITRESEPTSSASSNQIKGKVSKEPPTSAHQIKRPKKLSKEYVPTSAHQMINSKRKVSREFGPTSAHQMINPKRRISTVYIPTSSHQMMNPKKRVSREFMPTNAHEITQPKKRVSKEFVPTNAYQMINTDRKISKEFTPTSSHQIIYPLKKRVSIEAKPRSVDQMTSPINRKVPRRPNPSVHQVIETTISLTKTYQKAKAVEVTPIYIPKGLDTFCDRPCSCDGTSKVPSFSLPDLAESYDDHTLSPDTFVRKSIPYLYEAQCNQSISRETIPSDTELSKCVQTYQSPIEVEYHRPASDVWLDFGMKQIYPISKHASPSDLLPCKCTPKQKEPVDKCCTNSSSTQKELIDKCYNAGIHRQTERQIVSTFEEQQRKLKLIKASMDNQYCKHKLKKAKHVDVTPAMDYPFSASASRTSMVHSEKCPECPNKRTDEKYMQKCPEYDKKPNEVKHTQKCPECPGKNTHEEKHLQKCPEHAKTPSKKCPEYLGKPTHDEKLSQKCHSKNNNEKQKCPSKIDNVIQTKTCVEYSNQLAYDEFLGPCPDCSRMNNQSITAKSRECSNIIKKQLEKQNQTNNITYTKHSTRCPQCLKIFRDKQLHEQSKTKCDNILQTFGGVHSSKGIQAYKSLQAYTGIQPSDRFQPHKGIQPCERIQLYESIQPNERMRTTQLSQTFTCAAEEFPCAPPPTRRNTCNEEDNLDQYLNPSSCCRKQKAQKPEKTVCNDCCRRGKIVDCITPGKKCDPCDRVTQVLPQGFKISNSCHSKLHLKDLLIYEDSSCCCIQNNSSDTDNSDVEKCVDYCRGETVEDIRDAVERFMEARSRGIICDTPDTNKNICDQTRELCQGIEAAIAERENCMCPQIDDNLKCRCPTNPNADSNNCLCPTLGSPQQPCNTQGSENCMCVRSVSQGNDQKSVQVTSFTLTPLVDIHHLGLREMSRRRKSADYKKEPELCKCRTPKGKPPRDSCVCPKDDNCACPSATDEEWIEYLCGRLQLTRKESVKLQSEITHSTSGFKVMKKRKCCTEIITYDEAIKYYSAHEGLALTENNADADADQKSGKNKANEDGTCPGCGDKNCPGLWEPHIPDPKTFEPVIASRYAEENEEDQTCKASTCGDAKCPGMGPYGLLPPIPGGPVNSVKVTDPAERGPHKACSCETREAFESETYCAPEGPVFCECNKAKGSNVTCECGSDEEGEKTGEGETTEEKTGSKKGASDTKVAKGKSGKVQFEGEETTGKGVGQYSEESEEIVHYKVPPWNTDPCAPVGGFKLSVGCKGIGSPGLKGICCFNAMESHSDKSISSEDSTYVVYI